MSADNKGHAAPSTEGAPPAVETKNDATKNAPADASTAATDTPAAAEPAPAAAAPAAAAASETAADAAAAESAPAPAPAPAEAAAEPSDKAAEGTEPAAKSTEEAKEKQDVEMTDAPPAEPAPEAPADEAPAEVSEQPDQAAAEAEEAGSATAADADNKAKSKPQRKSIGGGEARGKKLSKKASRARVLHLDAKPGEYYFVKLKGHPQWPVIICDEDMLPASLLKTRPVTAKRADGTYREDFADGGKKVADRTFPVMYLHTNEFGWVPNSDLIDLDPEAIKDVKVEKKKALQAAYNLAAEQHPLSYYKNLLKSYQDDLIQQEKARAAKAATPKGKKKAASEEDEDVEMEDSPGAEETPAKDTKKRKAGESVDTPQRSDSAKKPKIKLTTSSTPKAANGATSTPRSSKAGESKSAKSKSKKTEEKKAEKEVVTPREPELSVEDRRARREKEVLFLRHKLQKGLLTRDQEPKAEEMKLMSDYITKLESFPELEVSIIRATKINKVLKAILKLESIPREDEFKFKPRSQVLLDKWNKLLAVDGSSSAAPAAQGAAAVNGTAAAAASKAEAKANSVEKGEAAEPAKAKEEAKRGESREGESKEEGSKEEEESKTESKDSEAKAESGSKEEAPKEQPKEVTKPEEGAPDSAEKSAAAEETKASEAPAETAA